MINRIAVLLTVFNRKKQTILCLESLFRQEIPEGYSISVFLTDDGCTDGTTQAVLQQFPSKVNIIQGDGNLFWNRGMWTAWNIAAKEYDYDFYLWLNDDTVLMEGALARLLVSSRANGDRAIIVGSTVDTETHEILTYGGRGVDGSIPSCEGQDVEVDHFNGNIVLIPRTVYISLGNLDYYFTHSKGDFDYGMRARKAGIKMFQCGEILGECDAHPVTDKWCDPRLPLSTRWKCLKRPNGMPPNESFHLNLKHYGLLSAIKVFFSIYLRCLCPQIWVKAGKMVIK